MDPVVVVSPHLDDSVLSCGQFMADWPGCTVYTVCAGIPPEGPVSTFDEHCGFETRAQGMEVRRDEDRHAIAMLRGISLLGHVTDAQYRDGPFPSDAATDAFAEIVERVRPVRILAPLGLVHPDHIAVGQMVRTWYDATRPDCELWCYEELPTRVEDPDAASSALLTLDLAGWKRDLVPKGRDRLADKLIAAWMYGSQAWALKPYLIACDERFWRMNP